MKRLRLKMVREDLANIPEYSLPPGFNFRLFKKGDEKTWANIETRVDEFDNEAAALERFRTEFGNHLEEMTERCLFIKNEQGEAIATTTAWYGDLRGKMEGRIHWVGVVPEYQGRGLANPLLSEAMHLLSKHHDSAYLTSQTTSYQAINMYLNYGFEPFKTEDTCEEAWALMEDVLAREID